MVEAVSVHLKKIASKQLGICTAFIKALVANKFGTGDPDYEKAAIYYDLKNWTVARSRWKL